MTPALVLSIIVVYFSVLIFISVITSRGADSTTFFTIDRQLPWHLVGFGMTFRSSNHILTRPATKYIV